MVVRIHLCSHLPTKILLMGRGVTELQQAHQSTSGGGRGANLPESYWTPPCGGYGSLMFPLAAEVLRVGWGLANVPVGFQCPLAVREWWPLLPSAAEVFWVWKSGSQCSHHLLRSFRWQGSRGWHFDGLLRSLTIVLIYTVPTSNDIAHCVTVIICHLFIFFSKMSTHIHFPLSNFFALFLFVLL